MNERIQLACLVASPILLIWASLMLAGTVYVIAFIFKTLATELKKLLKP